jgi:tetratricopeptide (TPR) repeat protein
MATVAALKPLEGIQSSPEAVSLAASAEAKLGQFEMAVSALRGSIATTPRSPHAYINLALIELDRGNDGEAETLLEQFRALHSQTSAKVFYTVSRNSCHEIANTVARGDPPTHSPNEKAEFYYQLATQLQEHFNFLSAAELIRLAQSKEGNSARVLLLAAASCLSHDPLALEPVMLLREAVARDPMLYKAYYLLGRAYTHQGRLEEAAASYRRAAELHPDASYYVDLGKALRNRQSSIAEFERALALDPSDAQAHMELGRTYVQSLDFDKARPELEKAIDLEPDYYEAYYLLGRLFHRVGDEKQSRKLLTLFEEKKSALMQQSVIGAGFANDGQ